MYLRLLAINARKQVPIERVMAYENAGVPLSIFSDEGTILSCKKSVFMQKLEGLLPDEPITSITGAHAMILDANAIVHTLKVPDGTGGEIRYTDMAASFVAYSLGMCRKTCGDRLSQFHVVFDWYFAHSVKYATREKRASRFRANLHHVLQDSTIPKD
jgi:hypothetical protein